MDHITQRLQANSSSLLVATSVLSALGYGLLKFNARISPAIPYAGEKSLKERLQVPVEYGKDPVEFLRKSKKQLGDVFCVDLFAVKIVFFLGPEGNKEIFRAVEDKLSFIEQLRWALGPVIYPMIDDYDWVVLSGKLARAYIMKQNSFEAIASRHCTKVIDEHINEWAKRGEVPLFKSVSYLVISVLIVLLLGEEFYREHGAELVPLMSQFERDLQHPLLRVTPNKLWGFTPPGKRLFATCALFDDLIRKELSKVSDFENLEEDSGRGAYLSYVIRNCGDKYGPFYGRHILTLVFGGHANVAMTIPWLLLHARRMPGALDRIREECSLPLEERKPFMEACLRETGRLYSLTSVMRMTKGPVRIAGHLVPAGTLVAASPLATQRMDLELDSSAGGIFKNAGSWNPLRFFDESGSMVSGSGSDGPYSTWFQRAEFVHFGLGLHVCPGERLARVLILDMVLRTLVQKYDVEVVSGLEEGVKGVDGVGAEAAWTEENFGTPSVRGVDPTIMVKQRS